MEAGLKINTQQKRIQRQTHKCLCVLTHVHMYTKQKKKKNFPDTLYMDDVKI
jgi:hypothetical protein